MPIEITEDDLTFSFEGATSVRRFGGPSHGMGHMQVSVKAVDFIVEFAGRTWLIEVKDPGQYHYPCISSGVASLWLSGQDAFRHTLSPRVRPKATRYAGLILCLSHQAPTGQIVYVVFIGLSGLDRAMLLTAPQNRLSSSAAFFPVRVNSRGRRVSTF